MTLSRIEVRNFQSLSRADIELGAFTVITGPNGSGKSALFRAMMLLALNARGTSYVTEAEKSCSVAAGNGAWIAGITRSNSPRGRNEYVTSVRDGAEMRKTRYTKLGGQVPEQVAGLLGLSALNFAQQHDPLYLLAEPGTALARKLGDLTNVSLVFGAAAEANRRRKQLDRDLEAARKRRDALQEEAREFEGLREHRAAIAAAEAALERLEATAGRRERLAALTTRLEAAEAASRQARAEAERQAPPSLEKLDALTARAARLRALAGVLVSAERRAARFAAEARAAQADEAAADGKLHAVLAEAGHCPVCGSVVRPD
jgi:DNA repair exonuclease SbcCD ATPase subunit